MLSACKAIIDINGIGKYDIIECEYSFSQSIDQTGKPSSRATGGIINVVLETTEDTSSLAHWMLSESDMKSGSLNFTLSNEKQKVVSFSEGICVGYHEYFNMRDVDVETNKPSMLLKLSITAKEITIGSATFTNKWKDLKL